MSISHGNLSPHNILIFKNKWDNGLRAKLSHFCCSGGTGTPGWQAPEQLEGKHGDMCSDKYVLGHILHFSITGEHLFGRFNDDGEIDNLDECNKLVKLGGVVKMLKTKLFPEAIYLINELLRFNPADRMSREALELDHPVFWNNFKRGYFMLELHNKLKELKSNSHAYIHLNTVRNNDILSNKDWRREIDPMLLKEYKANQAKQGNQANQAKQGNQANQGNQNVSPMVTALIRFFRNILQHLDQYRAFVGGAKNTGEAADYLFQFCPYLLIECFDYVKINWLKDEQFKHFLISD